MDIRVLRTSKLKLPNKLERLYCLFDEVEQVCMMMFNIKKQISLDVVAKNVAKRAPKHLPRLTPEVFSKLLHIYPTSYSVKLVTDSIKPGESMKHHYVLVPNFREDIQDYYEKPSGSPVKHLNSNDNLVKPAPPISPQKSRQFGASDYVLRSPRKKSPVKPAARPARLDFAPKFEAWRWKCRVKIFKYKMFEFIKAEHQKYLQEIGVEFEENDENLFHPDFVLCHLPEVPCARLPAPDRPSIQRTLTDYLVSVQQSPVLRSVEKVTQQLRTPTKIKTETCNSPTCTPTQTPMKSRMNLLERIRAKEREAKEREAARDPVLEKRLSRLEELKIRTLNIVYSEYANHNSLEYTKLYQRIKFSCALRQDDFSGIIEILAEIAPKYFALDTATSKSVRYLKILDKDLGQITQLVDDEIARCRTKMCELFKQH